MKLAGSLLGLCGSFWLGIIGQMWGSMWILVPMTLVALGGMFWGAATAGDAILKARES